MMMIQGLLGMGFRIFAILLSKGYPVNDWMFCEVSTINVYETSWTFGQQEISMVLREVEVVYYITKYLL